MKKTTNKCNHEDHTCNENIKWENIDWQGDTKEPTWTQKGYCRKCQYGFFRVL